MRERTTGREGRERNAKDAKEANEGFWGVLIAAALARRSGTDRAMETLEVPFASFA
jgi:hypothetical protein